MTDMPPVTICVVPRERYSLAVASLDCVLARTPRHFPMVYVDGRSPPGVAEALAERCRARGARYIPTDQDVAPNAARAVALREVETPYVIFVDNDVFPGKGWAERLVACAADTGAWAVTPLVMEGSATLPLIHMAGGDLREDMVNGLPTIHQSHRYMRRLRLSVQSRLHRQPCGFFEFHCTLIRRDCFERGCTLDMELTAVHEHLDLSMQIHRAGGEIYFEPGARVRYDNATPFAAADREFFEKRWSPEWTHSSIERFREKWGMGDDDAGLKAINRWAARHRQLFEHTQKSWLRRALPLIARREGRQLLHAVNGRLRA